MTQNTHSSVEGSANTLSFDPSQDRPKATIQDVAWITGHWHGEVFGGAAEEIWSPPLSHSMMGMFRLMKNDAVEFYELLTIVEEDDSLVMRLKHFNADMTGWEEKEAAQSFPLVKVTPDEACFDGLTFRKMDDNWLKIFLRMHHEDSVVQEIEFDYRRDELR
jgi:hypothetical protein